MTEPTLPTQMQPSIDDVAAASLRALAIRLLLRKHGGDLRTWPRDASVQYEVLLRQQEDYERVFSRR